MQEEFQQFMRLEVWELVERPDGIFVIGLNGFGKINLMQKELSYVTNHAW
jgi:hypothetical protein